MMKKFNISDLRNLLAHILDYEDITEARDRIGHFITQVYHQKRSHSALGDLNLRNFGPN